MNFLADRQFWGDIANNTRQAAGGLLSATLGAPVDIATMVMRPFGYKVDDKKVVGSSEHIAGLLGLDTESIPYKVASLMPTDATDLMKYGGLLGTFAGVNAKTANKALLEAAQKMDKSGVDRAKIWQDTGWFKGPEGKWRFEIDDSAAVARTYNYTPQEALKVAQERAIIEGAGSERVKAMEPYAQMSRSQLADEYKRTGQAISQAALGGNRAEAESLLGARSGLEGLLSEMAQRDYGPASAFLKHKELGAAYPDVYKLHTRISPDDVIGGAKAQYQTASPVAGEQIVLSASPKRSPDNKSSLLHEMQHAIQQREGFAAGGNPMQPFDDVDAQVDKLTDPIFKQLREVWGGAFQGPRTAASGPLLDEIERLRSPKEIYRRLAGEAEARAVQSRMNLSPAERRAKAPWESYDVPWEQLIVRGQDSGGLLSASAPKPKYGAVAPGLMGSVKSVKGGLLSDGMKKAKPLTEAQFNRAYMAHKDLRGVREGTLEQNLKSIAESGFRRGFNVNLLPPYAGGAPTSIVDRAYAPKAGDVMYLIPQEGRVRAGNGFVTKEGYKPAPHEVLRITEDFPSLYQEYLKAWAATNKP